ncbi:hypothetical protein GCM10008932_03120 [Alkalibacterium iburiense]|uniref:Uncharacterized protein n=1 Tax=Alkalibacterium iburiense TaxID=290589 RepID=A0ABN0X2J3_9LACT
MSIEDQDFIMRQIKLLAKGIGALMDINSLKELLFMEFSVEDELSDHEVESLIYMARVEDLIDRDVLTNEELETYLGVSSNRINQFTTNSDIPTEIELEKLKQLVDEKMYWD